MPAIATPTIDPLKAFIAGASAGRGRPIPLDSTRFDVDINGGLVTVVTKRVFRNDEADSIEAMITFPVPVHAVLFNLEARIDGRSLKARAQRRKQARDTYEDAIERGKSAVLHEEVLRGIHMLSVGHIGPGKEIEVTAAWAAALNFVGDQGQLRIPLTVGDIYGRSGLPDSDDLVTGGPVQTADLFVRCRNGAVTVRGVPLKEGHARVALNAPIDLVLTQPVNQELRGAAADGHEVILRIAPHRGGDMVLSVAVVVDHSGSMSDACSGRTRHVSKHDAVVAGLRSVTGGLREDDVIDLWEFDDQLAHLGSSHDSAAPKERPGQRLLSLINSLTPPRGGTEIGSALSGTIAASRARDILLITDGKSYALDVQELARKGRRITVLLVGEDSLEANVGHLAALSGGDIFVAAEGDIAESLAAAIGSLRAPSERPGPISASLDHVRTVRGNALLEAEWRPASGATLDGPGNPGIAAMAASLALPALDEERAALLAEAEGLVTHLTSLVLVDEEGEVHEGLPAARKVALPAPGRMRSVAAPGVAGFVEMQCRTRPAFPPSVPRRVSHSLSIGSGRRLPVRPARPLAAVSLDWDVSPNRLLAGDLSALDPLDASVIEQAAAQAAIIALAKQMSIDPIVLVVALLAQSQASGNRSAERIARAVLDRKFAEELRDVARLIGLAAFDPG